VNQIIIKNLKIFAYHGVHKEEKLNGQNFFIDAVLTTSNSTGYKSDKLTDVTSYSDIIKIIRKSTTSCSYNLIEKTAEVIAENLFDNFFDISQIELTLKKPEAPIHENFEYVGVKITRKRNDFTD
jgi:dihydroneopterin aldolase